MENKKELNLNVIVERVNKAKALFLFFWNKQFRKTEISRILFIDFGDYARLILWEVIIQLCEYIKTNFPDVNLKNEFPRLLDCRNSFAHNDDLEIMKEKIFKNDKTPLPDYLIEVINKIKKIENNK